MVFTLFDPATATYNYAAVFPKIHKRKPSKKQLRQIERINGHLAIINAAMVFADDKVLELA